ncbi:Uncharacterised protein [Raoultella planticola]|uniref:Uncharacterized protein n=1 Tax=Raoultella planticola TaxID=575 RepID=A0A485CGE9_RAOPL|nr:Uncharacterised protein [Raoultella planticola]
MKWMIMLLPLTLAGLREATAAARCPAAAADYRHGQPGFRLLYAKRR